MPTKMTAWIIGVALVVFLVLFEVQLDFEFSPERETMVADAGQEERFAGCVEERDRDIHRKTFGSIDNPDVQREVLASEKQKAVAACRELFPQILVPESQPLRFNLVDVKFRY